LNPSGSSHGVIQLSTSEAFRTNQCPEQIDDQSNGDDADDVFHGLELSAGVGVRDAQNEEDDGRDDEDQVGHGC
jgi:hypothetical protein